MFYRTVKRGFDILSSLLALIVLSPIFLIICISIKLSSKGPVFYKSTRVGLNNEPFTMYKFRSMHIRAEGSQESRYIVNHSRIFKFGNFLRKSKFDELPQLINILLGDMSVVGPRPYGRRFVDSNYVGDYANILTVRPGLACLDSLYDYAHGELFVKDEKIYAENILQVRTELAKMYVERKGISLDVYCIFRTVVLIFKIVVLGKEDFPYTKHEIEAGNRSVDVFAN